MASTLSTTDVDPSIKVIAENMNKHIQYLQANVTSLKNLPKPEEVYKDLSQKLWYKLCLPCRSSMYGLCRKDYSWRKKGESVSHPLADHETMKEMEIEIGTLRQMLKERDRKLNKMEEEKRAYGKRPKKNPSESKQNYNNERTLCDFDTFQKEKEGFVEQLSQLQTERQTLEDQNNSLTRTNEELSSTMKGLEPNINRLTVELETKQADLDKSQQEIEEYIREASHLQTEKQTLEDENKSLNRSYEELSSKFKIQQQNIEKITEKEVQKVNEQLLQLQTEKQTLESQTNSLTRTNEELSSTAEGLQRDIGRLRVELEKKRADFDRSHQENEKYIRKVSQLEGERKTREDQTISLNKTNEELSSTLEIEQQNIEKMTEKLEEKDSELDKAIKENERHIADISQLQTEKQTLQDKISSLNRTNEEMVSVTEGLKRDIDRLTRELEKNRGDFDTIRTEKDELLEQLSQLQTEKQTLENQKNSLTRTNEELSSTEEGLQQHIDRLTAELEKKQSDFDQSQKENEEYVEEISQLQSEKQTVQATLKTGHRNIEKMTEELVKKDEEIANLKAALEECRRLKKKVVVMRLLRSSRSGLGKTMVEMVNKELKRHLGERLDSRNFDFSVVLSESPADVSNGPLFVLCLNMSRVGTNIQDALEGTKGGRDVYVLVLHHTNKENLSTLTPTRLRVTGSELRQLGGIFDLAFSSNSGLYECDLNITTIDKIATVLKKV